MSLMRYIKLFSILTLFFASVFPVLAGAQENPGLQIQPAILDVSGQIDQQTTATVLVKNTSANPLAVTVSTRSLVPEDELIDASASDRYDASKWIELPNKDFLIDGLDTVEVPVEITVPPEAVPGGHYAFVVFRIVNNQSLDSSGIVVNQEAAAVLLITVPGEVEERLEVQSESNARFLFGGNFKGSYTILNTGNTHVLPVVETQIKDSHANVIDTIVQPVALMLPNTKRTIEVDWESESLVGLLAAETTVSFGTPLQRQSSQIDVFIVGPSIAGALTAVAATGLLGRYTYVHLYKARKNKQMAKKNSKAKN